MRGSPQWPQKTFDERRYSSVALLRAGALVVRARRCCTWMKRSWSMMAGMPFSMVTSS